MEIRRYADILNRRKGMIIFSAVLTLVVVALGTIAIKPTYSASAMVRVVQAQTSGVSYSDLSYTDRLIQTYVRLLKSRPFLEEVASQLSPPGQAKDLTNAVTVEAIPNTELIWISSESPDRRQAAAIANTLAMILVDEGPKIYDGERKSAREVLQEQLNALEDQLSADRIRLAGLTGRPSFSEHLGQDLPETIAARISAEEQDYATLLSQYDRASVDEAMRANSISVVESALVPSMPSKPNLKLNLALGALIGLVGGLGMAFLFENLDPTIHSADELASLAGVPLLGSIPGFKAFKYSGRSRIPLVAYDRHQPAAEAFAMLSTFLLPRDGSFPRTVLISSAEPRSGKSTVLVNLAASLVQAGLKVIVVDGNLRKPCLHEVFNVPIAPGLAEAIGELTRLNGGLQQTQIPYLKVLAAGRPQANPRRLWHSSTVPKLLRELAAQADVVLWDSPPMLAAADAAVLATMVDRVVLVAARDQSSSKHLALALAELNRVGANVLGVIYNLACEDGPGYFDYNHRNGTEHARLKASSVAVIDKNGSLRP
jgi:polysaccharide biosynthesis transport protein